MGVVDVLSLQLLLILLYRCQCGKCEVMPTNEECVCCTQIANTRQKMECETSESSECSCIVQHPGFEPVCLNQYVLETAYYQYRQQYGERDEHGENE